MTRNIWCLVLLPLVMTMESLVSHHVFVTVWWCSMRMHRNVRLARILSMVKAFVKNRRRFALVCSVIHGLECLPRGDSAKSALHVCVDDLKAVDVGCIDPAEAMNKVSTCFEDQRTA